MSKAKKKTPHHTISGLLSQPTPANPRRSTRLSKSFNNEADTRSVRRKSLRQQLRHSAGSAVFNQHDDDLHFMEFDEDTETPRTHIAAFLQNAETDPLAPMSTRRTPGRQDARSFTRTPSKVIRTPTKLSNSKPDRASISMPSPGSLFTPRANIENFLQGSGTEYSPRTRSMLSRGTKSDTKVVSTRRSRNWAQRVSASPMYNSSLLDADDENGASPGERFRSLRKRRSFHIPEPVNFDLGRKSTSLTLDLRETPDDSGASPGRIFKHPRSHRSFHIPEPSNLSIPGKREKVSDVPGGADNITDANQEGSSQQQENDEIVTSSLRGSEKDQVTDASILFNKDTVDPELKDKMKIYDLSDGSSDLDINLTPSQQSQTKSKQNSASHSGLKADKSKTLESIIATIPRSSPRLSSRKRPSTSSQSRTPQSLPKMSHSTSRRSVPSSKRRRLSWEASEAKDTPDTDLKQMDSSPLQRPSISSVPPSSTPVKRQTTRVSDIIQELSITEFSKHSENEKNEVVSILPNDTLPGLSPIRAEEEDKEEQVNDEGVMNGLQNQLEEESPHAEVEDHQTGHGQEAFSSQKSLEHLSNQDHHSPGESDHESSGDSSAMQTPNINIDMSKRPPPLSGRKLNLLTPFREKEDLAKRATKKTAPSNQSAKSKKSSGDSSFVSRKMIKFYTEQFSSMRMDKEVIDELVKASDELWTNNLMAADGYAIHAGRKTITEADVVLLMKVQRMIKSTSELHDLIREHLPMELRCDLIPTVHAKL